MSAEKPPVLLNKESLYQISELNADKIINMSDDQLITYQETLTTAINLFPVQKHRLQESFRKMDYPPTLQWLKSMRNTLNKIHADNLVRNCDKQINQYQDIDNIKHDRFKTFVEFTVDTVEMLYNDIQLVLNEVPGEEDVDPQETFAKMMREQIATITEINETAVEKLKDDQLKTYAKNLMNFPDESVSQMEGLKGAFKIKNYPSVMRWLNVLEGALTKIHADGLAEECRRQINLTNDYSAIRHEKLEIFIKYIITSMTMLCNDIDTLNFNDLKKKR